MKEPNLAKAIDKAAQQRAEEIIKNLKQAISDAAQRYWRPKNAGEEFIGDDVRGVLRALAASDTGWRHTSYRPSAFMVDACRAAIVNDLLKGLPKIADLMRMAELNESETDVQEE